MTDARGGFKAFTKGNRNPGNICLKENEQLENGINAEKMNKHPLPLKFLTQLEAKPVTPFNRNRLCKIGHQIQNLL